MHNMSLIGTEISGDKFNKIYSNTNFYKFLNDDLTHHKFVYRIGLNKDIMPFIPDIDYFIGGLYFCEENKCDKYWKSYGLKLALIEIPDDARVFVGEDNFKADKLIVREIIDFCDVSDKFWINLLKKDGRALKYIKEQSEEICKQAVHQNGLALQYIENQTDELCKLAVQQNGQALYYVKNQNEELCIMAIQEDGRAFQFVEEQFQTERICKIGVQYSGWNLQFVKKQTDEICKLAVQQNGHALEVVNEQLRTDEIRNLAKQTIELHEKTYTNEYFIEKARQMIERRKNIS